MRPIDADRLMDALYDNKFQTLCPLDEVAGVVDAAPTLDVQPVDVEFTLRRALANMWYAYVNKDSEYPHEYELEAVREAEKLLGRWEDCMPIMIRRAGNETD